MAQSRETRPLAPQGLDPLDDKVRQRLTEIMASAGVPHSQISLQVLYYLPRDFLKQYEDMFMRAVKSDGGESGRNQSQQQAADVGKATGPGAKTTGKRFKRTFVVRDEKALALKTRMDKRLRAMARDIEAGLAGADSEKHQVSCSHCGQFLQLTWNFCPGCGTSRG